MCIRDSFYADTTEPLEAFPTEPYDTDFEIQERTIAIRSLLNVEGIRFIFTSFVSNFAGFSVVAVVFVAMMGAGVAEESGLMTALIHKLVEVSPRWALSFIIIFVGVLSSVATDAGYLILIPLGAAAFLSVKRNPLVGVAAAYGGVSAIFAINIPVSYTHLDVYKRQGFEHPGHGRRHGADDRHLRYGLVHPVGGLSLIHI